MSQLTRILADRLAEDHMGCIRIDKLVEWNDGFVVMYTHSYDVMRASKRMLTDKRIAYFAPRTLAKQHDIIVD